VSGRYNFSTAQVAKVEKARALKCNNSSSERGEGKTI